MTIPTDKIKLYILPNLPYAFLFWLFEKFGEAYRVAQGSDALKKLISAVANLNITLSQPLPSLNPFDICVGLIGAAAVYCVVLYKKRNAKKWRKDVVCCKGGQWITTRKHRRSVRLRHRRTPKLERSSYMEITYSAVGDYIT